MGDQTAVSVTILRFLIANLELNNLGENGIQLQSLYGLWEIDKLTNSKTTTQIKGSIHCHLHALVLVL